MVTHPIKAFPHPKLQVQRFRIVIAAGAEGLVLPAYSGSTLRGALGHALRDIACTAGKAQVCSGCFYQMICPVTMLFNPLVPDDRKGLFLKGQEIPAPFVLRPYTQGKSHYQRDETFEVEMTLFGKAMPFAPYLLSAFARSLERGLGKGLRSARVVEASVVNPFTKGSQSIYEGGQWNLATKLYLSAQDVKERVKKLLEYSTSTVQSHSSTHKKKEATTFIKITFKTPLRLKADKRLQDKLSATLLFRGLLRRLSVIAAYYGEQLWKIDFAKYIKKAEALQLREEAYTWTDWERYSSRQNAKMKLGGLMGYLILEGESDWIEELLPILLWGQLIHLGKATSFGLGDLEIEVFRTLAHSHEM
ncbi:CRISPR system precrRNA processing endoribonuclease RAMP protein Cas6 [Heliorestis convoluta]|uniref:CRISPR-associated protein Cas6 C-terminal domain-containing protein n=1 Tax=Heliorestis convoluta TaxID=356322 RepID=A0A5Q2N3S8_9FIRM|nr:CRISPR system precrRNA processing endoribonuclease RAMP protein Cas6 [Heliorestis convoluta]QGG48981.1 hypothetical protein FTV88_2892 [Heliorestis convoluta]